MTNTTPIILYTGPHTTPRTEIGVLNTNLHTLSEQSRSERQPISSKHCNSHQHKTQNRMNKIIKSNIPTIQDFTAALYRGEQAIRDAANILCQMVDADSKTYEKIHKETGIHWNVLANLERVGRGAMHYKLLFDSSPASKFLITMPQSQQAQAYENGIPVVTKQGGKTVVETKKPQELTAREARAVFNCKHIRTVEEQLKLVGVEEKTQPQKTRLAQRWEIRGEKCVILAYSEFTMTQLEAIVDKMKDAALKSLSAKK
jgi:hypothetical protein